MANQSTKLPSPNSRRSTDPSTKPVVPGLELEIAPDAGVAVCTANGQIVVNALPTCVLTGSSHAEPLRPITIAPVSPGVFALTFAESVENNDVITWPERDPAIRGRNGAYIAPMSYTAEASGPTPPQIVSITWQADGPLLSLLFDQDMASTGADPQGLIRVNTPDGLTLQIKTFEEIAGPFVACTVEYATNLLMAGTGTSVGIGTCLVADVGALPAEDFTNSPVGQAGDDQDPKLVYADFTFATKVLRTFWASRVINNMTGVAVRTDDGTDIRYGSVSGVQISNVQVNKNQNVVILPSANAHTLDLDANVVTNYRGANPGNLAITDFALPNI